MATPPAPVRAQAHNRVDVGTQHGSAGCSAAQSSEVCEQRQAHAPSGVQQRTGSLDRAQRLVGERLQLGPAGLGGQHRLGRAVHLIRGACGQHRGRGGSIRGGPPARSSCAAGALRAMPVQLVRARARAAAGGGGARCTPGPAARRHPPTKGAISSTTSASSCCSLLPPSWASARSRPAPRSPSCCRRAAASGLLRPRACSSCGCPARLPGAAGLPGSAVGVAAVERASGLASWERAPGEAVPPGEQGSALRSATCGTGQAGPGSGSPLPCEPAAPGGRRLLGLLGLLRLLLGLLGLLCLLGVVGLLLACFLACLPARLTSVSPLLRAATAATTASASLLLPSSCSRPGASAASSACVVAAAGGCPPARRAREPAARRRSRLVRGQQRGGQGGAHAAVHVREAALEAPEAGGLEPLPHVLGAPRCHDALRVQVGVSAGGRASSLSLWPHAGAPPAAAPAGARAS
jgi:hypothetical protein